MKDHPLHLKKRTLACENKYFSVYFDSLEQEGCVAVEDYLVVAPKTLDRTGVYGVGVLPVMEGKVGLLQLYRHPANQCGWELPGGFMEPGESLKATAVRELREEVGLICSEEGLRALGYVAPAPSTIAGKVCVFAALECHPCPEGSTPELGHGKFEWFSKSSIENLIESEDILEASTLIALYRARTLF